VYPIEVYPIEAYFIGKGFVEVLYLAFTAENCRALLPSRQETAGCFYPAGEKIARCKEE
jgi:hypothetical protein